MVHLLASFFDTSTHDAEKMEKMFSGVNNDEETITILYRKTLF